MKLVATKHHCMNDQNRRLSEENESTRPLGRGTTTPAPSGCVGGRPGAAALVRSRTTLERIIRPSHINQGSESLLATISPIMRSDSSCPTSATKHLFSRSSVGRRIARTPWTSSCRYAASFRACSSIVPGESCRGMGERARRGHREWYTSRGLVRKGGWAIEF